MPTQTRIKTACQLTTRDGSTFDAVMDLIEITYNERIVFWNGVVELTREDGGKLGSLNGGADIGVRLADGRGGVMTIIHVQLPEDHAQLAAVGKPNHPTAAAPGRLSAAV